MDLPLYLETLDFTYGFDELKQDITLLLKNYVGEFLQDASKGSIDNGIHANSMIIVDYSVRRALSSIPGLEITSLSVNRQDNTIDVYISFTYNGKFGDFQYKYSEDEN